MLFERRPSTINGAGLFTCASVAAGTRVVEYFGEKIPKSESARRCAMDNTFIFGLDDDWDLDGSLEANDARFINHSCEPNCETECIEGRVWVVALRHIAAGEEFTYNYGYDLADYHGHPCHCGAPSCVGYIVAEDFFPLLRSRAQYPARNLANASK